MNKNDPRDPEKLGPMGPTTGHDQTASTACEVTRTYLEMSSRQHLVPGRPPSVPASLDRIDPCTVDAWRALYRQIGAPWHWHDRDVWHQDALSAHLTRPDVRIYRMTATLGAEWIDDAGFLELERHGDGSVEIGYLGLDRRVLGQRLGGWLVTEAVQTAFAWGANRVWLHTCTLDAPAALPNYLARGFSITRIETYLTTVALQ